MGNRIVYDNCIRKGDCVNTETELSKRVLDSHMLVV